MDATCPFQTLSNTCNSKFQFTDTNFTFVEEGFLGFLFDFTLDDFLLENFEVHKEARSGEIDAIGKAKAVLSGADYSLLQVKHSTKLFLGRQ